MRTSARVILAMWAILASSACGAMQTSATPSVVTVTVTPTARPPFVDSPAPARRERPAMVLEVVDGETITALVEGETETVGLLLLDASSFADCLGTQARDYLNAVIPPGSSIDVVTDVTERDSAGQLMAYVYRTTGQMVNEMVVSSGLARAQTMPPNVIYYAVLAAAAREAENEKRGLWRLCPPS